MKKDKKIEIIKNLLSDCFKERKLKRLFFLDEKFKIVLPKK